MTPNTKSIFLGAAAVLSWSTVATAFKIAGQHMSPFEMVLVSSITAFAILCIFLTFTRRWAEIGELSLTKWGKLAILGAVNPVIYYLVLFKAYAYLPAQVAQPINYTWPILLLVLLAVFNGQKIPALKYIGMFLSLAGVACISFGGRALQGGVPIAGIALGFLSALLWASFWLLNKTIGSDIDATVSIWGTFLFGSAFLCAAALFTGWPQIGTAGILSGMYIGAFEMAIPFICFGIALRITSNPALINQMCYLSPFLSLFFIATVLGEPIAISTVIGLVLIVGGIVFNEYFVKEP